MQYDVYGMCNALFDIQAEVQEETLSELDLAKGSMALITDEQQRKIVSTVYTSIVNSAPGGSGANTMIGVAQLGGTASFTSRVGPDQHGERYRAGLLSKGVKPNLGVGAGDTGVSLILITPDAQRTMLTFLGMSRSLQRRDVVVDDLVNSKFLYVTGYLWDTDTQKDAVLFAMSEANRAGVHVALSLSDPFCVHRHKQDFLKLLREHVDVVIGNAHEAMALTETESALDAVRRLGESCRIAAVTMDERGSLLWADGAERPVAPFPVKAVDTTGAGDMYAAGLLYGLTHGLSIDGAGRLASYMAAQVVAHLGPRLEEVDREAALAASRPE
jgi:hypothetical protein